MADPLTITRGKTLSLVVRWETEPIKRVPITGISFASGAPRITAVGHGVPDGWRCCVTMAKGPTKLNAQDNPPSDDDYHKALVISADVVEFNELSPVDDQGREWPAWVSGGFLCYNTPADLTGYIARMSIKDKVGGTVLLRLTTENGGIIIDPAAYTITLYISSADTAALTWKKGVFDLELESPAGFVPPAILYGDVVVGTEVTT